MDELHKKMGNETHYWKAWLHRKKLFVESGIVGVNKNKEEIQLGFFENGKKRLEGLVEEKRNQGFVDSMGPEELIIQIYNNGSRSHEDLQNASMELCKLIEKELDDTGVGFTDGVGIGDDKMVNIFCMVDDLEIAIEKIRRIISEQKLIDHNNIFLYERNVEEIDLLKTRG
ncbi:MAG: hypothetical protein ABS934_14525 [Psychrobacillus sp.]